jgi:thiamine-phosphate pyrophosphorylase
MSTIPGTGASRRAKLQASRLYLVCDCEPGSHELPETVRAAVRGGVDVVQLREKHLGDEELVAVAHALARLCRDIGALLIVNDRPTVALESGADGVHVGQDDMPVGEVRELLGDELLVGLSTHSPEQIDAATRWSEPAVDGAIPARPDYIGVGPVHETPTKPGRPAVGLEPVRYAAAHATLPFFAIGGIDLANVATVRAAGASRIAVLRAIAEAPDPERAARRFREALDQ